MDQLPWNKIQDKEDVVQPVAFDTEHPVSDFEPIDRLEIGEVPVNWLGFREALYQLMKKHIRGVDFIYTNMYSIYNDGFKNTPAITCSVTMAKPLRGMSKPRLDDERPASPNIPGARLRSWATGKTYTVQFNCWAESEEQADMTIQKLHDFFKNSAHLLLSLGIYADWEQDLLDMEIDRLLLKYSVRSAQYRFDIQYKEGEIIPEIAAIDLRVQETEFAGGPSNEDEE